MSSEAAGREGGGEGQVAPHYLPFSLRVVPTLVFPHPSLGTVLGARNTDEGARIAPLGCEGGQEGQQVLTVECKDRCSWVLWDRPSEGSGDGGGGERRRLMPCSHAMASPSKKAEPWLQEPH